MRLGNRGFRGWTRPGRSRPGKPATDGAGFDHRPPGRDDRPRRRAVPADGGGRTEPGPDSSRVPVGDRAGRLAMGRRAVAPVARIPSAPAECRRRPAGRGVPRRRGRPGGAGASRGRPAAAAGRADIGRREAIDDRGRNATRQSAATRTSGRRGMATLRRQPVLRPGADPAVPRPRRLGRRTGPEWGHVERRRCHPRLRSRHPRASARAADPAVRRGPGSRGRRRLRAAGRGA